MHRIVDRKKWIAERKELLLEEKEFTRRRDALAEKKRALPWVRVEKDYEFDSAEGRVKFADLFRGRSQLWVQSVMQGPGQPLQCVGCALGIDHIEGLLPHLENHDVSYVAVARATMPELTALRERMGWRVPFFSSYGSDFNYDFGVSIRPEDLATGRAEYNYAPCDTGGFEDLPGDNVFYRDDSGNIFHTYSCFARGGEDFMSIYRLLECMPKGRNESADRGMTGWVRPHNMYGKGGEVLPNARFVPPVSCCM
jgi:predicted dithiol-disulfide oxidoreductase (DUF899 family)